jgi:hypothetical protein
MAWPPGPRLAMASRDEAAPRGGKGARAGGRSCRRSPATARTSDSALRDSFPERGVVGGPAGLARAVSSRSSSPRALLAPGAAKLVRRRVASASDGCYGGQHLSGYLPAPGGRFVDYMTTKRGMADALRAVIASGGNPFAQSRDGWSARSRRCCRPAPPPGSYGRTSSRPTCSQADLGGGGRGDLRGPAAGAGAGVLVAGGGAGGDLRDRGQFPCLRPGRQPPPGSRDRGQVTVIKASRWRGGQPRGQVRARCQPFGDPARDRRQRDPAAVRAALRLGPRVQFRQVIEDGLLRGLLLSAGTGSSPPLST